MDYIDDDSNSTTSSFDCFDEFDELEYDTMEDIFMRDGIRQMPSSTSWTYESFSQRGAEYCGTLKSAIIKEDQFHLEYNYVDNILYDKMKIELERTIGMVKQHLHEVGNNSSVVSPFAAFATVCPEEFFIQFHKWLTCGNTAIDFSLPEMMEFWRCELIMMSLELSTRSLRTKVSQNEFTAYESVKNAMFRADKPPSARNTVFGVAKLPPFTFDPIVDDVISSINKLWVKLFFAPGVTWVDLDDDKIPKSSPLWKRFGWRLVPTKDMKLKPVFHLMASVACGFIVWMYPNKLITRNNVMLREAVNAVVPSGQPAIRSTLTMFLDRGYFEISKPQTGEHITNLIQLLNRLGVRFLGTVKDTNALPFLVQDKNTTGKRMINNKAVTQSYGMRTRFSCTSNVRNEKISVSVLRNGVGKIRSAKIATNHPMFANNDWVYESKKGDIGAGKLDVSPHATVQADSSNNVISGVWNEFLAQVIILTEKQRTTDWFLMRMFRFTSTTLHVVLNVNEAIYLHDCDMKVCHQEFLSSLQLTPNKKVTLNNSLYLNDEDVGDLRSGIDTPHHTILDEMMASAFYLRGNPKRDKLVEMCSKRNLKVHTKHRRIDLATMLAEDYKKNMNVLSKDEAAEDESTSEEDEEGSDSGSYLSKTRDKDYYLGGKVRKAQLQSMCTDEKIKFSKNWNMDKLATLLANNFNSKIHEELKDETESEPSVTNQNQDRRWLAFHNRLIKHWFMHPFKQKCGGAMDIGTENEGSVLKVLGNAVRNHSKNQYRCGKIREYGLICNKDAYACATSPDGIVPIYKYNELSKIHELLSLCVVEIKTKQSVSVIHDLELAIEIEGSNFSTCEVGVDHNMKRLIPEPGFRTQVCQHAIATQIPYVLMVYSLPGALVKKIVLLHFNKQFLKAMLELESMLANEYLGYAYSKGEEHTKSFCVLGNDLNPEYGYAIEHHTIELYIRLWKKHHFFVVENGTPPPCRRLLDKATSCWNKCMGNVDTVRKVLGLHKVKRGSNTGPGSLQWYQIFNYICYNAWRVYCLSAIHKTKITKISTWSQFRNFKKKFLSFRCYLDFLSNRDNFGYGAFDEFYPGLRQKLDRLNVTPEKLTKTRVSNVEVKKIDTRICTEVINNRPLGGTYCVGYNAAISTTVEYALRLRHDLPHKMITNPHVGNNNRVQRLRCVLCCYKCVKGIPAKDHYREGRQTVKLCSTCKIAICNKCEEIFHSAKVLPIPECVMKLKKYNKDEKKKKNKVVTPNDKKKDQVTTPDDKQEDKVITREDKKRKIEHKENSKTDAIEATERPVKQKKKNGEGFIVHEIGLLSSHEVKEIKKDNDKLNELKDKCSLLPSVKPFDIKNDHISETESPEKGGIPQIIFVTNTDSTPTKELFGPPTSDDKQQEENNNSVSKTDNNKEDNLLEINSIKSKDETKGRTNNKAKTNSKDDDDATSTDTQFGVVGNKPNPHDEGEGIMNDEEEPTCPEPKIVHRSGINIKPDPDDFASKWYLSMLTRRSRNKIRAGVLERIEKYGTIQNVVGDGNCGFYASIVGLEHQGIPVQTDIYLLRQLLSLHVQNSGKDLFGTMSFRKHRGKKTKEQFIEKNILPKLWKPDGRYQSGCSMNSWLHADTIFPIMADYFHCNFIWFDVVENFTKALVCKEVDGREINVMLERKGFVNPRSLCSKSIWDRRVICIFFRNHYMAVKEFVKV